MTPEQNRLLQFIRAYTAENDYPPTFDEMSAACRLASKSNTHKRVNDLVNQGLVERRGSAGSSRSYWPTDTITLRGALAAELRRLARARNCHPLDLIRSIPGMEAV